MRFFANILNRIPGNWETVIFPLFYALCRLRFYRYTENEIKNYQLLRAREIARHAVRRSSFFAGFYEGSDVDDFISLPKVNKRIMMDNLTGYNTVGLSKEEILEHCEHVERTRDFSKRLKGVNVGMSSGTSGNKGVEIVTRKEESYMKAALFARFAFPKGEKINLAFILRVSAPAFSLGIFGHKLTYISQLDSLENIRMKLAKLSPNVVSAPPSMLHIIAKEVKEGRLDIKPKIVVSYAEVLYPDVREHLKRVFGCEVHEIYKCTEGPIAISCPRGSLHINEDLVLVEALDADGNPSPPGKPCHKLIVTDLHKRSQPILRYELNDLVTISAGRCDCGSSFRVIERIQGRADDLFWARRAADGQWQFIFPDYISRAIITSSELIEEYQAVQEAPDRVAVRIQLRRAADQGGFEEDKLRDNLTRVFEDYGCDKPNITVTFGEPERNVNSDKLIRIHRNFEVR